MFADIAANPKLATAEALRRAMLSTMDDHTKPEWVNPSAWAPFVLIG
jgi:CHAT domain-containing protein